MTRYKIFALDAFDDMDGRRIRYIGEVFGSELNPSRIQYVLTQIHQNSVMNEKNCSKNRDNEVYVKIGKFVKNFVMSNFIRRR